MEPHPSILDRALALSETAEVRTVIRLMMDELVNYGTWVLVRCQASAAGGDDRDFAPVNLYRHVLEACDGIAVLCDASAADSGIPLLRSLCEAQWGLRYIVEDDDKYVQRSLAYMVTFAAKRRAEYERLDTSTTSGQRFEESLREGWATGAVEMPDSEDAQRAIANLDQFFAHPHIAPIKAEYDRLHSANPRRPVTWHSLFGGPVSLAKLAAHLREGAIYEILYGDWSTSVHATDAYGGLAVVNGVGTIKRLRQATELASLACHATQLTVGASRAMLGKFRRGDNGLADWYASSIRPHLVRLGAFGPAHGG